MFNKKTYIADLKDNVGKKVTLAVSDASIIQVSSDKLKEYIREKLDI